MKPTPEEKARPGKTWGFKSSSWRSFLCSEMKNWSVHIFRIVSLVVTECGGRHCMSFNDICLHKSPKYLLIIRFDIMNVVESVMATLVAMCVLFASKFRKQ